MRWNVSRPITRHYPLTNSIVWTKDRTTSFNPLQGKRPFLAAVSRPVPFQSVSRFSAELWRPEDEVHHQPSVCMLVLKSRTNAWGFISINIHCLLPSSNMVLTQRDNFIPVSDKRGYTSLAVLWKHGFLSMDATRATAFNLMNSVVWKSVWAKCRKSTRRHTIYGKQEHLVTQ